MAPVKDWQIVCLNMAMEEQVTKKTLPFILLTE